MGYTIAEIDITDQKIELELRHLFQKAFNTPNILPFGHIFNNVFTHLSSKKSFFLAALDEGKILGCMGFMALDFSNNETKVVGYQCVWAATLPEHQGKKIFVNLVKAGQEILRSSGAGFLYCLAGDNTDPIFIEKLGFHSIPSVIARIPNIPILNSLWFAKSSNKNFGLYTKSFTPPEEAIADLKKNTYPDEFKQVVLKNNSFAWGKIQTKNVGGFKLNYFYLGGVSLQSPEDYQTLIKTIFQHYKVSYVQIVSCKTNRFNDLITYWKPAKVNGFLFYELNVERISSINMTYGIIDVF